MASAKVPTKAIAKVKPSAKELAEVSRKKILATIDEALGHTWIVQGENRSLLIAVRKFFSVAKPTELKKLGSFIKPT